MTWTKLQNRNKNMPKKDKTSSCKRAAAALTLGLMCAGVSAAEGAGAPEEVKLEKPEQARSLNRFDLRARFQFNVQASFGGIGAFAAQKAAGTPVGTRMYDDGFVLDDPDGNTPSAGGPLTDNWQYQNASQVRAAGGDRFLDMNISSAAPSLGTSESGDGVQPGFELVYSRELGRGQRSAWGLQGSLGYTRSSISDKRGLSGPAFVFTDSYLVTAVSTAGPPPTIPSVMPGAAPPPAGSTGTLIPVTPAAGSGTTTVVPGGSVTTGSRELETDIVGFRFGPYLECGLTESLSLTLGAGGVGALINSQFQYTESTTIPGMGPALQPGVAATQTSSGSVSDTEFKAGAYAEVSLNARINERWDASLGAQYQYAGRFGQRVDTHTASLNLEHSIGVFGGIRFKF